MGINPIDYTYDYKLVKQLYNEGITHILIDEISMIPSKMWCVLAYIKIQYGFIFIGFGDFKQLKPVKEEHIDIQSLRVVKELFNYTRCELKTIHRFNDCELLRDAYKCSNGECVDTSKYGKVEHDLSLAWTNECVNSINKYWNEYYAKQHKNTLTVNGNDKTTIILYSGLEVVSYRTPYHCKYTNAETLTVERWNGKVVYLKK